MSLIRKILLAIALSVAGVGAAHAADATMFRDGGCGCCLKWLEAVRSAFKAPVKIVNSSDMMAVKARHGVPVSLAGCHTAIVDGLVIEGHVPAREIARLLRERPKGVRGLAVAGMPTGSPGMEFGDRRDAFEVVSFGSRGQQVFARYPAR